MPPILFLMRNMPIQATQSEWELASPRLVRGTGRITPTYLRIYGVTKDSTGAALGSCAVDLFRTADDVVVDRTTSDASGNYEFRSASLTTTYYVVAYKAGSPDVAGTTVNTLIGG